MSYDAEQRRKYNQRYYERKVKQERKERQAKAKVVDTDQRRVLTLRLRESLIQKGSHLLNEAINTGSHYWKNQSQMYEEIFVWGLQYMAEHGDETADEMVPTLKADLQNRRFAASRKECQAFLNNVRTELKEALAIGEKDEATRHFWSMVRIYQNEAAQGIWQHWVLRELKKAFPDLAKTPQPPISLDEPPVIIEEPSRLSARPSTTRPKLVSQ